MRIDSTTIGRYICRASVKGYREIDSEAELFMKGPPRILTDTAIAYGRVGSNVELGKYFRIRILCSFVLSSKEFDVSTKYSTCLKWASIRTTFKILGWIFIFSFPVCNAFGIPPPRNILWINHGFQVPIDGNSDHFKVITHPRKDGLKSTLIIRPVTESDFGEYNCTAPNTHGVDSYVISLKEERK